MSSKPVWYKNAGVLVLRDTDLPIATNQQKCRKSISPETDLVIIINPMNRPNGVMACKKKQEVN